MENAQTKTASLGEMKKNLQSFCKNYIIKQEEDENTAKISDKKKRKKKRKKEILCSRC